jgi:hypothetical protein
MSKAIEEKKPAATIQHTGTKEWDDGEYSVDAPDGYRFAGLECHHLVVAYAGNRRTRKQGYLDALAQRRDHALEQCPADCPCMEE